jgi:hypothetical protein
VDTEEAVVIEEAAVAGNAVGRQEGLPGSRPPPPLEDIRR